MEYITITANFDDIDQAERAATAIKNKVENVISVSLRSKKSRNAFNNEGKNLAPDYFLTTNNLNNPTISGTSAAYPAYFPVNVVPDEFRGVDSTYKRTKLTAKVPLEAEGLVSSIILSNSGHYISF